MKNFKILVLLMTILLPVSLWAATITGKVTNSNGGAAIAGDCGCGQLCLHRTRANSDGPVRPRPGQRRETCHVLKSLREDRGELGATTIRAGRPGARGVDA